MSFADKTLRLFSRDIVFSIIRIGTGALIARYLGPTGFGVWAIFELTMNYCRVFGSPRYEISAVHFLGKAEYSRGEVVFSVNFIGLLCGIFLLFLFQLNIDKIQLYMFKDIQSVSPALISFALLNVPFIFLRRNYLYYFLSQEDVKSYNMMMNVQDLSKAVISIFLLVFLNVGLWAMAIGLVFSSILASIYGIFKIHLKEKVIPKINWKLIKDMGRYSFQIYFAEGLGFLNIYVSNLITALLLNPTVYGFFSMGKGKAELLNRITSAVGTILYPRVANQNKEKEAETVQLTIRIFKITLVIILILAIVISIFFYPFVLILYGEEFLPATYSFWIIIPSLAFYSSSGMLRQYFLGIGRPDYPLKISIIAILIQIPLLFVLITFWGYIGASIGVASSLFVISIITIVYFCKITGSSLKGSIILNRDDINIILQVFRRWFDRLIQVFFSLKKQASLNS